MSRHTIAASLTVQGKLRAMQTAFRFCVSCKQQHALVRHPVLRALLGPARGQRLRAASVACAAVGGGGGSGVTSDGGDGGSGGQPSGDSDDQRHATANQLGEEVLLLDVSGMKNNRAPTVSTALTHHTCMSGMKCGGCVSRVKGLLEEQPEVATATVNLATETAMVRIAPDALQGGGTIDVLMGLGKKLAQV